MRGAFLIGVVASVLAAAASGPAGAIPVFAHRYGLTCQACHTEVPHLTPFGGVFLANGYRLPGIKPKPAFPVSVRIELAYASADAGNPYEEQGPLPKTIVDEVEFLTGGAVGSRGSYWAEAYAIDGGFPGVMRDAWFAERLTPDAAGVPVVVRAGQFTLPLPLDPETFRETTAHYAIWDQSAGGNPFTFFGTKQGLQIEIGNSSRQLAGSIALLNGHDTQSGLPAQGFDTMATLSRAFGNVHFSAYRYDGSRPIGDRFWRNGFSAGFGNAQTEIDAVYQIGNDTGAGVNNTALVTSGGFVQARRSLGARAFALARWDATSGPAPARSITAGFGYRLTPNSRLTVFETGQRDFNGNLLHIISSSLLLAY